MKDKVKDTLIEAIELFNLNKKDLKENFEISNNSSLYKIKLCKKSGLPNIDLPSINSDLKIEELNDLRLSIPIEDSHIKYVRTVQTYNKDFDVMTLLSKNSSPDQKKTANNTFSNHKSTYYTINIKPEKEQENNLKNSLLPVAKVQIKKKFCCC